MFNGKYKLSVQGMHQWQVSGKRRLLKKSSKMIKSNKAAVIFNDHDSATIIARIGMLLLKFIKLN